MKLILKLASVAAITLSANAANAATCLGNCGTSGANGVVTLSPSGNANYQWISTNLGSTTPGVGEIASVGDNDAGTNTGSQFTSNLFTAAAGDDLTFFFNYVTSDGGGFADYAWTELLDSSFNSVAYLFTARTQPTGDTSPGFGLPANSSTLTPATTPIIPGGPAWAPLGTDSGRCFSTGCGYTGWIKSTYEIAVAGNYYVRYGVTDWSDSAFKSGLAFDGLAVNDVPVDPGGVPEPATWLMMIMGFALVGAAMRRNQPTTLRVRYS